VAVVEVHGLELVEQVLLVAVMVEGQILEAEMQPQILVLVVAVDQTLLLVLVMVDLVLLSSDILYNVI
jgi:hypothetical protein